MDPTKWTQPGQIPSGGGSVGVTVGGSVGGSADVGSDGDPGSEDWGGSDGGGSLDRVGLGVVRGGLPVLITSVTRSPGNARAGDWETTVPAGRRASDLVVSTLKPARSRVSLAWFSPCPMTSGTRTPPPST